MPILITLLKTDLICIWKISLNNKANQYCSIRNIRATQKDQILKILRYQ